MSNGSRKIESQVGRRHRVAMRWLRIIFMVALLAGSAGNGGALGASSDTVLAARAIELFQEAKSSNDHSKFFEVQLFLDQILADHPRTMTALRVKKNKLAGLDVDEARRHASSWRASNQAAAEAMRLTFANGGRAEDDSEKTVPEAPRSSEPSAQEEPKLAVRRPPQEDQTQSAPRKFTRSDVVQMLKDTTVLILVMKKIDGRLRVVGSGSGFFINSRHVLTNAHVVKDYEQLVIASDVLGVGTGNVIAYGQTSKGLGTDAAVVDVAGLQPNAHLSFGHGILEGDNVAVGGYPGVIRHTDRKLTRLIHFIDERVVPAKEDVPSPRFSFGAIEGIFINPRGNEDIQHGLETTGGNSGSPIVNSCGHVVGLHYTGVSIDRDNSKFNYAHSHREVEKFLRSNRIPFGRAAFKCNQG